MSRLQSVFAVLALSVLAAAISAAPAPPEAKGKEPARSGREARERLAQSVSMPQIEPNTPLKEALDFLGDKFGLSFEVDKDAFAGELQIAEAGNQPVKLAKMTNVRLDGALRLLLGQANGDTFIQPDGTIWIVPKGSVAARLIAQRVTATFDKKPLDEVLKQVSDQSGVSIVLDVRRAADKARQLVTADVRDLTLEAAVMILADLAELKVVQIDRALYVTTPENARELRAEQERKHREELEKGNGPPPAAGAGAGA